MKIKSHIQSDAMLCGVTCLRIVCEYWGKKYSADFLSHYCFATNEGVSILAISEAAEKIGLHSMAGRATVEQLENCPLPCLSLIHI